MLERNNPFIDAGELEQRATEQLHARALPRAVEALARNQTPPEAVATAASVEELIRIAEEKAQVRTAWSGRLNRFPFNASAGLQRMLLRTLAFLFKDQRHVNFALIEALRELLAMNIRLTDQVERLAARVQHLESEGKTLP